MNSLSNVDLAVAAWVVTATIVAVFMFRRGHSPAKWVIIAFLTGPISIVVAAWARHRSDRIAPKPLVAGTIGPGPLAVLVGIDGSPTAKDALVGALEILGDRVGRLTLAAVIDFDSAAKDQPTPARTDAEAALAAAAEVAGPLLPVQPHTILLPGAPAVALVEHALSAGDDLIVIGTRGRGDSDWLQGSATRALAEEESVRVMIVNRGPSCDHPPP